MVLPENYLVIDFETYWDDDYTLKKLGPIEYIRSTEFELQLCGAKLNHDPVKVIDNIDDIQALFTGLRSELESGKIALVAHNGNGFDFLIVAEKLGVYPKYMYDTIAMMRWTGLSRIISESHAALTEYFGHGEKQAGTVLSRGKHWPYNFTGAEQQFFTNYCADDVSQCAANFYKMLPYVPEEALHFMSITARMATEPAFWLMPDTLKQYIQELDVQTEEARAEISRMFKFDSQQTFLQAIRSKEKFATMLRLLGCEPPIKLSAKKTATKRAALEAQGALIDAEQCEVYDYAFAKTDLEFLELRDHSDPRVALLVETRLSQNSSMQRSRAERFLKIAETNKPMPVMLNVFKAHTSRYTAGNTGGATDGTQLQNLSKRDPKLLTLRKAIRVPDGFKVIAADSSQIEARILAYVANQTDLLQQFANDEDPYSMLAEKIFGVAWEDIKAGAKSGDSKMKMMRNVGKTGILSAGYQVGHKKFSDTLLRSGIRLSEDLDQHREQAKHAWNVYRLSNSNIVEFWATCQKVIEGLAAGSSGSFGGPTGELFKYGPLTICNTEEVPSVVLPSGFTIRYPGLRCERNETGKSEYCYDRIQGMNKVRTKIYGGSLCENLCQSLAFQLLMWQARQCDKFGIILKGNNHDAWITVHHESVAKDVEATLTYCMGRIPPWLPHFPVACEGEIGDDYTIA